MKSFVFFTVFLFSYFHIYPQKDTSFHKNIAKNTIYVEGFGNGSLGSLNYDRLFFIKNQKLSFRMGLLFLPIQFRNEYKKSLIPYIYTLPLEINLLFGKKNHLEVGLGLTYAHGFNSEYFEIINGNNPNDYSSYHAYSKTIYSTINVIGYRFQQIKGGFFFKSNLLIFFKMFELNKYYKIYNIINNSKFKNYRSFPRIYPYLGLSIGYTFKTKKI